MDSLRAICEQESLRVEYTELTRSKRILGWYLPQPVGGIIILDNSLKDDPPMELWVLSEEIGHHKTATTGSLVPYGVYDRDALHLNRINRWKDESRATRWAAKHLMPTEKIAHAIREGVKTAEEMAEYFGLKTWMVMRRLNILRQDVAERLQLRLHLKDLFSPLLANCLWGERKICKQCGCDHFFTA